MGNFTQLQTGDLSSSVDDVLAATGIMANPYFVTLEAGEMSLETFQRTQQQFYFAVDHFPRPMAALLMRLPHPEQRLGILDNIAEEHGNHKPSAFHEATFRQFLNSIGADANRPKSWTLRPAVHAFNATVMSACLSDDVYTGIACLGIIEYAYADISALIGNSVLSLDWIQDGELFHYKLHAEMDKRHAAEFFHLLHFDWEADDHHEEIMRGLRLGAYAFDRLYRDLL